MEELTIREFKAKISEYLKRIGNGEIINVKGLLITRFEAVTTAGTSNVVTPQIDVVTEVDILPDKVKPDAEKISKFEELKRQFDVRQENIEPVIDITNPRPGPKLDLVTVCAVAAGREGAYYGDRITVPRESILKNPVLKATMQEIEVELELEKSDLPRTFRTGFTVNDGRNPIPKPIKKKKNEK